VIIVLAAPLCAPTRIASYTSLAAILLLGVSAAWSCYAALPLRQALSLHFHRLRPRGAE
jgi:hypothetical protein